MPKYIVYNKLYRYGIATGRRYKVAEGKTKEEAENKAKKYNNSWNRKNKDEYSVKIVSIKRHGQKKQMSIYGATPTRKIFNFGF